MIRRAGVAYASCNVSEAEGKLLHLHRSDHLVSQKHDAALRDCCAAALAIVLPL